MKRVAKHAGLTLVEMLVVIGILAALATVFKYGMTRLKVQSQVHAVERMFTLMDEAFAEYEQERGSYPEAVENDLMTDEERYQVLMDLCRQLLTVPNTREILARVDKNWGRQTPPVPPPPTEDRSAWLSLEDPWGKPFSYHWQKSGGDVFPSMGSAGPDRKYGTADDILNR